MSHVLTFYNTLTGKKEEFKPIDPKEVRMYTCGPTVYNYAHIGNLRAYVFADVLRRTLEYTGYKVKQVMNITDVGQLTSDADEGDDKMIKGLKREGLSITLDGLKQLAEKYTSLFIDDLKALNIELPHEMPRASKHIKEDIELVQKLKAKGVAYKTSDGIYFDVAKFPEYGTRGGFKLGELKEGARVEVNKEKHTPRDFALWKFSTTEIGWESPWGRGFPGWHIECSAMVERYLGKPFNTHTIDIHTGGIDHIPTHHQNEIAQSKTAYGDDLAKFWMHNEFVNMGEAKMAKSGENFITLQTLRDRGVHPLAYRYYLMQAHYRSPIAFSSEALQSAQIGYQGLITGFISKEDSAGSSDVKREQDILSQIKESLNDDLNAAYPIGLLWSSYSFLHTFTSETLKEIDALLGLELENQSKKLADEMSAVPEDIKKLASARDDARRQKDFKKSDELREQIQKEGFEVMDTDSGPIIRKKL